MTKKEINDATTIDKFVYMIHWSCIEKGICAKDFAPHYTFKQGKQMYTTSLLNEMSISMF